MKKIQEVYRVHGHLITIDVINGFINVKVDKSNQDNKINLVESMTKEDTFCGGYDLIKVLESCVELLKNNKK